MNPLRILVTGASGFVGRAVVAELVRSGHRVTAAVRDAAATPVSDAWRCVGVGDLGGDTDWSDALCDIDAVVHLAARVHVMHDTAADPLAAFRAVNLVATGRLAAAAAAAGVRRFVFVSSIKVNGEQTRPGEVFRPDDKPAPQDPYGQSKWEAEQALAKVAAETGLEVAIIRPPLVYGPGVGANFLRLLKLVDAGVPLPFASIDNRRSMVFVGNLASLVGACLTHPAAAGRTFLAGDGESLSTPALIRHLAAALGRAPRLWRCPPVLLDLLGRLAGRRQEVRRLLDSLAVADDSARQALDWRPPFGIAEGMALTVNWYRARHAQTESAGRRRL